MSLKQASEITGMSKLEIHTKAMRMVEMGLCKTLAEAIEYIVEMSDVEAV
jgi:hypothetical protein